MRLVLALALLSLSSARADTVKIYSGLVGDPEPLQGSGMYFTRKVDGKLKGYVVTSDHVVYHSNDAGRTSYNHMIQFSEVPGRDWARVWAKFLAAEEGNGLALLEIQEPGYKATIERPFPPTRAPRTDEEITTSGFPFGSRTLLESHQGYVAATPGQFP